uniref:Uncharacterized protein n=1 Tax=Panagrolaimus superbus TaxID=310955 RepID=A0A914YE34_9BILA
MIAPQLETFLASKLSKENISLYVSAVNQANALQLRQACVEFVRKIFYDDQSLSDEEMESFDMKFMKDVFAFSRKI